MKLVESVGFCFTYFSNNLSTCELMDRQYSKFQQKAIKNFYDNRGAVGLQRLQELVTDLYLAEGKKREKTWGYIEAALAKTGIKPDRIAHLKKQDDPQLLAKVVEELLSKETK